jgi:hypothetical protein
VKGLRNVQLHVPAKERVALFQVGEILQKTMDGEELTLGGLHIGIWASVKGPARPGEPRETLKSGLHHGKPPTRTEQAVVVVERHQIAHRIVRPRLAERDCLASLRSKTHRRGTQGAHAGRTQGSFRSGLRKWAIMSALPCNRSARAPMPMSLV